jgi:long-chain acyl-CoA synthetase
MPAIIEKLSPEEYADVVKDGKIDYNKLFEDHLPLKPFEQFKQLNGARNKQAVPIPGTAEPGFSSVYRNVISKDGLINKVTEELDTVLAHFEKIVEIHPDYNCLGKRLYKDGKYDEFFTFKTFQEVKIEKDQLGSGIRNLLNGIDVEDEVISIFSPTRPEWVISSYACQSYDLVTTSLYDTLGPTASKYILNFTKSPLLITTLDKIVKAIELSKKVKIDPNDEEELPGLPYLKFIVSMDELNFKDHFGLFQLAEAHGIRLLDFNQVIEIGKSNPLPFKFPTIESGLSISFTSGTTGNPKGVKINHKMGVSAITFTFSQIKLALNSSNKQVKYFAFLPLAHIYELLNVYSNLAKGFEIAFPHDPSPLKLVENLKIYKPNLVTLVPRIYTKIESAIKSSLHASFTGRSIISKLIEYKSKKIAETNESPKKLSGDLLYVDSLIVKKLRAAVGFDEVEICISGSAPIAKETLQFLKAAFNIELLQGYGLTETFAGSCIETPNQDDQTCGAISIGTEIKLKDLPAMNYTSHDANGVEKEEPTGELILRGDQIFSGYYKNQKATDEVLTKDGWFHTGDVAKLDKYGRISIIDRVKNFFKLAQGEYVTPERIENIYLSTGLGLVTQIFVYGDSYQTYLVSIIGVDPIQLRLSLKHFHKHHHSQHFDHLNDYEILEKVNSSQEIKNFFINFINDQVKDLGLQGFEKIHNFKFVYEPLKLVDGTITPTLKIKRVVASKFFEKELQELYQEGSLVLNQRNKL